MICSSLPACKESPCLRPKHRYIHKQCGCIAPNNYVCPACSPITGWISEKEDKLRREKENRNGR